MPPVAGDQVIGLADFGHGEQEIVRWIGTDINLWQRSGELGECADLVQHRAGRRWPDVFLQAWVPGYATELLQLVLAADQPEAAHAPALIQIIRRASRHNESADQDIGIEDVPHQDLFGGMPGADGFDGLGDCTLDFCRRNVAVGSFGFRDGAVENPPPHGILHKLRQIALTHPVLGEVAAQGDIRLLRNDERPANHICHNQSFDIHLCVYTLMIAGGSHPDRSKLLVLFDCD